MIKIIYFFTFLLLNINLFAANISCPENTFEVDMISSTSGQRIVSCTKKENGKYLKHGPEIIYGKDGSILSQNYYNNNVLSEEPKAKVEVKIPIDNSKSNGNTFVSQEFAFSITKINYWFYLNADEQKEIIKFSNTSSVQKNLMREQIPANIVLIAREKTFSRNLEDISYIPRLSVSYVEKGTPQDLCERFKSNLSAYLLNGESCVQKKLNNVDGFFLEFTASINLLSERGDDLNAKFDSTITLWVVAHKNKNLILFIARGDKKKFKNEEIDIENIISSFKLL